MNDDELLQRYGFTKPPFDGTPSARAFTPPFSRAVAEPFADLRAGRIDTLLLFAPKGSGHAAVVAAVLNRLAESGDMVARFGCYPDSPENFLQGLLDQWGLEVEQGSRGELRALVELYVAHHTARGRACYCSLPRDGNPSQAVQDVVQWLAGLHNAGAYSVRVVLLASPDTPLPEFIHAGQGENVAPRRLRRHELPGLSTQECEHYIHTRLRGAGCDRPQDVIDADLCRLAGAYASGIAAVIDRLMQVALRHAAERSDGDARPAIDQHSLEAAAEKLGLQLVVETLTAETSPNQALDIGRASLTLVSEGDGATEVKLVHPRMVLGREQDCDIPLDSRFISRFQCLFMLTGRGWYVLDLGSTNGTFVNSRRVREHLLSDGDMIVIGRLRILFRQAMAAADAGESRDYLTTQIYYREIAAAAGKSDTTGIERAPGS